MPNIAIHWFRQDLRVSDNPSLLHACQQGKLLPIYILDDINAGAYASSGASRAWLHHSLKALNKSLKNKLRIYKGDASTVILDLCKEFNITSVSWNRCYEPWRIEVDKKISHALKLAGISTQDFNASLLWEPWHSLKADGSPYKVFTPYYKNARLHAPAIRTPLPAPSKLSFASDRFNSLSIEQLDLLAPQPWHVSLLKQWDIGEVAGQQRLRDFINEGLNGYKEGRNFPDQLNVSRLSPHLHWGEVSAHQAWHYSQLAGDNQDIAHFHNELAWREFAHSLLYHYPDLPEKNWQAKFDQFNWLSDARRLRCWQQGLTGYPIVDAGMRELWQTGYMHNRVRMIVGSFLVKNLRLDWRLGQRWFWDCLVDADLANNASSWQWIAGCGADAAPYFRIFNPTTQGEKFDAMGIYTKRYVPELAALPNKYLFKPWLAPTEVLKQARIELGLNYPKPIIDLKLSRLDALDAYKNLNPVQFSPQ